MSERVARLWLSGVLVALAVSGRAAGSTAPPPPSLASERRAPPAAVPDRAGGGALFSDYRRALSEQRIERAYRAFELRPGETVHQLLQRIGPATEAGAAAAALTGAPPPAEGRVDLAIGGAEAAPSVRRLRYRAEGGLDVAAWRADEGWRVQVDARPSEAGYVAAASVMTDSLFGAGARAGVPRAVMTRFANLFLYDVDFARDIRAGDRFEVVYAVRRDEDGAIVASGDIVFAAMSWRGGTRRRGYYRFEGAASDVLYYDAGGVSAQRLLMKTPIEGARVTSRFGSRRHPTLGYTRAHKGVDFGARAGTPVMAAGDGEVVRAGAFGSYGNFLLLRHTGGFETAYAHLRGFAPGVRPGARVRQGEVVGYVGSTGRSTGPHLHYEVRSDGRPVNPVTLDVATGAILTGDALSAFAEVRDAADALRGRPLAVSAE